MNLFGVREETRRQRKNEKLNTMMRVSLALLLSLLFYSSYGQKGINCDILKALLRHDEARQVFYFDIHKEVPIIFVDLDNYFSDCEIADHDGRPVKIVHDSAYLNEINYSNIIVNRLPSNPRHYMVSIWYKKRNALFYLNYKTKNGKIIITKFEGGYF